jgi:preprotein translocase subunit SecA
VLTQNNTFFAKTNLLSDTNYLRDKANLLKEPDYGLFQLKSLELVTKYMSETDSHQWNLFCEHLDLAEISKSEKLILLQTVVQCVHNPIERGQLAQLITLATHLIALDGTYLFHSLFSAKVAAEERVIKNYLTICQLLIELHEVKGIISLVKKTLPQCSLLIEKLQEKKAEYLAKKFPPRNIDETITRFEQKDDIVQFPLSREELAGLKIECLKIQGHVHGLKSFSFVELKERAETVAESWRVTNNPEDKYQLIAIIAELIRHIYKIEPYDTQLLSLLALINKPEEAKGRLAQIKTGEGKSTIIAMLTALMASQGHFVDVVTSSEYLAKRDCKKYTPLFEALGLSSSHICYVRPEKKHFQGQILYGTNSDFQFALLRDGLYNTELRYSMHFNRLQPRTFDVVIIDEVDNFFLSNALNSARLAIRGPEDSTWIYSPILEFVKNTAYKEQNARSLVEPLRQYLLQQLPSFKEQIESFSNHRLTRLISSAKNAWYTKQEKHHYVVKATERSEYDIVPVDYEHTGDLNEGSQWQHGLHQFLQVKHGLPVTPESLTGASINQSTYFNLYQFIIGLTGTMGEQIEREEIQKMYQIDSFDIPPHYPSQRKLLSPQISLDREAQYSSILSELEEMQKLGRPSLVLFKTIKEAESFCEYLKSHGKKHQLLSKVQQEAEDYLIGRAGDSGMITISTNAAGRGTDILLAPKSKAAGGLHMIFAFYPDNLRVEGQGFGRAGRQGQEGSCRMVLNIKDQDIQSLLVSALNGDNLEKFIAAQILLLINEETLNANEVVNLFDQLRTKQIFRESKHRCHAAQVERLHFEKLTVFFEKMQKVFQSFQDMELKKQCIELCQHGRFDVSKSNETSYTGGEWKKLVETTKVFIEKQKVNAETNWDYFLSQFTDTYITHFQTKWALFYSKLQDGMDSDDAHEAQVKAEEMYAQVQMELDQFIAAPNEHLLNCLNAIFHLANEVKTSEGLSSYSLFSKPTLNWGEVPAPSERVESEKTTQSDSVLIPTLGSTS